MNKTTTQSFDLVRNNMYYPYQEQLDRWFHDNRARLNNEGVSDRIISDASSLYKRLCMDTTKEYMEIRKNFFDDLSTLKEFSAEISRISEDVFCSGKIEAISSKFVMSRQESVNQCKRADDAFTSRPDLQRLLADANYSFFTGRTMATANDLLDADLLSFYTEGMPHLTASNGAIGHSVKDYVMKKSVDGKRSFLITDMGSGSGATLAGIMLGLKEADRKLESEINVHISSIEGCHSFYEALKKKMVPSIISKAAEFSNIRLSIDLSYGDILENTVKKTNEECRIYTANYVFHRISDRYKELLLNMIGEDIKGKDSAFFFADIYRNTSEMPNRRYFNFTFNGPLNPGNDVSLMKRLMEGSGFRKVFTDEDMSLFPYLPKNISDACVSAKGKEQGFFMAGYSNFHE